MKKQIALTLLALISTVNYSFGQAGGPNPANANLVFTDANAAASGSYLAGGTFTLSISLNYPGPTPSAANGVSYFLESRQGSNGAGISAPAIFTLTSRTLGTVWPDPQTPSFASQVVDGTNGNQSDLGASGNAVSPSPTSFSLGTLTISIASNATPGTYTIQDITTNENFGKGAVISGTDVNFTSYDLPTAFYTVTIVPEPATWSLVVLGGLGFLGFKGARHNRRS